MSANEEMAFGLRVRELRQSREWSQGRLAQEMRQPLGDIEHPEVTP